MLSEIRIDPDLLEREFLGLAAAQGISGIDELNAILDRAVELKEMLKFPERVAKVARFIAPALHGECGTHGLQGLPGGC